MKNLNNYIIEKLRLNKHIGTDQYKVGDRCLVLSITNWKSKSFLPSDNKILIHLDVMKIKGVNDNELYYKYLSSYYHKDDIIAKGKFKFDDRFYYNDIDGISLEIILPMDEGIEVLEEIENNKEFELLKLLDKCPNGFEEFEGKKIPITFSKDFKELVFSKEDIDKLIKLLKND